MLQVPAVRDRARVGTEALQICGGMELRRNAPATTASPAPRVSCYLDVYVRIRFRNVRRSMSAVQTSRARRIGVHAGHDSYKWWALSCTSLGMLLATMNSGTLIIALPDLERSLEPVCSSWCG